MRTAFWLILAAMPAVVRADEPKETNDSYAAIGYNARTGEYWFSYGMATKELAESEIAKRATDRDKLTLATFKNCYCSLAMSADRKAFGIGQADSLLDAQEAAVKECRKKSSSKASVLVTLHTAQGVGGDSYFAIAYSTSTGRYGVSVAKASQTEADAEAVSRCDAKDAKTVATAKNACCSLALGKDKSVFGVGVADNEKEAAKIALEQCEKKTTNCAVVVTLTGKK